MLKNSKKIEKNIKFDLHLNIDTKIILYGWINHLNFKNEEPIHKTDVIRAMHSTIAQLSLYILIIMILFCHFIFLVHFFPGNN
jgi:hypothetical protein